MTKKCKYCKAPIEGLFAKVSALAGVKQSLKYPDYCNKCEAMAEMEDSQKKDLEKKLEPKDLYEAGESGAEVKKEEIENAKKAEPKNQGEKEEQWAEELKKEQADVSDQK